MADIAEGNGIELPGEVRLRAYSNNHLGSACDRFATLGVSDHGRSFERYSMSLEHRRIRVVYSGNLIGPAGADEMAPFIEPADLLISELSHLDPA